MHNNTSRHHRLSQFHGGKWNPENIIRLNHHVHESFHVVFGHDTPIDQMRTLLNINEMALHPEVVSEIKKVLDRYSGILELSAYNPKCVNVDKFIYSKRL